MGTIFLVGRAKRALHWGVQSRFRVIGERAKRVRHPLLLPLEKMFGRKYVKTTMRMLTILREARGGVDARASMRSPLAVRECNYENLALPTSKRRSACTSNNFTFAGPLMGTIFYLKAISSDYGSNNEY